VNNTDATVNQLIDIFTGRVMTKEENEILYRTVRLIHDLDDQVKLYKSVVSNQSSKVLVDQKNQTQ
jgi:hypothetical protein